MQEKDLQHRIEELSAVYNIAGLLAGTMDLQEILNKTARMVCEVMKVKACSIRLLDETTGTLTIKRGAQPLRGVPQTRGRSPSRRTRSTGRRIDGELVHIADAPNDPRTRYPRAGPPRRASSAAWSAG